MSSVSTVAGYRPGFRTARRPFYADWAVFFAAVTLLGAFVAVDFSFGSANFVSHTLDRLDAHNGLTAPAAELPAAR